MATILIPDAQFDDDALLERAEAGPEVAFTIHRARRAEAVPAADWASADALIAYHEIIVDAELLARMPRCRVIVRAGVGFDAIDLAAAGARGIPVCNVPDYGTSEVADHAIALLLALCRGIVGYTTAIAADPIAGWDWRPAPLVRRLRGSTLGVIGLGRIGLATARRARGLDMRVVFFDPYLPDGADQATGLERALTLGELLEVSDAVTLHCPHTAETDRLIDAAALQRLRPHAVLINTARGRCVDTGALARALREGRLAGAALDVLPAEPPLPGDPLIEAWRGGDPALRQRLIVTPHAAWYSPEGQADLRRKSARTAVEALAGGPPRNCVNAPHLIERGGARR